MNRTRAALTVTAVIIALWRAIVWIADTPHFILPGPVRVAETLFDNIALIGEHALATIAEIIIGLLLGALLGIATAVQLSTSKTARTFLLPVLVFSQAIPVFALAPVLTLWMGYGLAPKILMTVLIVYFPVASAFYDGLTSTPRGYLDLARSMGASKSRLMLRVQIPAAVPSLATGLRLAAVYAPIGAIIGEWVGASQGLGYLMLLANGRAKIDLMFAALAVLAVITVILRALVDMFCRKILARWSPELAVESEAPRMV